MLCKRKKYFLIRRCFYLALCITFVILNFFPAKFDSFAANQAITTFYDSYCLIAPNGDLITWGWNTNGLVGNWLETRDAGWVLAIAYPMGDDLRDETLELAQLTERDRKSGIDNTCGFRFYRCEASCIPLYELLDYRSKKTWEPKINIPALKNAILDFDPDYARKIFDDDLDLLKEFSYTPGAGTSFYQFPPAVPE